MELYNSGGQVIRWREWERKEAVIKMDAWKLDYSVSTDMLYHLSEREHKSAD